MYSDIEAATLQANSWIYSTPQRLQDQAFLAFGLRPADLAFPEPILFPGAEESACISVENSTVTKSKRKYSKSKLKTTSSTARLSQCSSCDEPPIGSADYSNPNLGGINIMALRGLSPPTPESTEDEPRAIMVEIPGPTAMPHMIGLASMLTPETSPANTGLLMQNGSHTNGGKHHHVEGSTHLDMHRLLESPLPVIEPGALEAYLHHVESEGCIPVFGLRSDMTNVSIPPACD